MEQRDDLLALAGRNVVVLGVADESSIAWGIARAFSAHQARVTIGYQQRFFSRVRLLLKEYPEIRGSRCDVLNEAELSAFFAPFREDPIDVLVHSIASAPAEAFTRNPSEVSLEALDSTINVSALSLLRVVQFAKPSLRPWSSVVTLSFQAASRAFPPYGMMGVAKAALESIVRYLALELGRDRIRVNAISPAPLETLSAYGEMMAISGDPDALGKIRGNLISNAFAEADQKTAGSRDTRGIEWLQAVGSHVRRAWALQSPIEEPVTKEDVAGCALFLGSQLSAKITGQVIHVDSGFSSSCIV
ncbi:MAG: SDR family oxidoreductase [Acidobacteria bacterium]|nr:MAG: SDR family oxidoreductase [Acidobacteriota bacterium]